MLLGLAAGGLGGRYGIRYWVRSYEWRWRWCRDLNYSRIWSIGYRRLFRDCGVRIGTPCIGLVIRSICSCGRLDEFFDSFVPFFVNVTVVRKGR